MTRGPLARVFTRWLERAMMVQYEDVIAVRSRFRPIPTSRTPTHVRATATNGEQVVSSRPCMALDPGRLSRRRSSRGSRKSAAATSWKVSRASFSPFFFLLFFFFFSFSSSFFLSLLLFFFLSSLFSRARACSGGGGTSLRRRRPARPAPHFRILYFPLPSGLMQ